MILDLIVIEKKGGEINKMFGLKKKKDLQKLTLNISVDILYTLMRKAQMYHFMWIE